MRLTEDKAASGSRRRRPIRALSFCRIGADFGLRLGAPDGPDAGSVIDSAVGGRRFLRESLRNRRCGLSPFASFATRLA